MESVVIADLGTGNLRSVRKAVEHVAAGRQVKTTSDPADILEAGHLVLPGQGAIGTWMAQLGEDARLAEAVRTRLRKGPVLGICLGLQALFDHSEENGGQDGLGVFPGQVLRFTPAPGTDSGERLKIPHMGWNRVGQVRPHPLWDGIADRERFYFVHGYYVDCERAELVAGETDYGHTFCSAAARGNLFAVQFHPEKSQQAGLRLLQNFVNWNGVH